jgi:hypothetical protein
MLGSGVVGARGRRRSRVMPSPVPRLCLDRRPCAIVSMRIEHQRRISVRFISGLPVNANGDSLPGAFVHTAPTNETPLLVRISRQGVNID